MSKRKVLTVAEKTEIIRRLENGEKNIDVSKTTGLASSTVSSLWKSRASILAAYEKNKTNSKRLKKCEKPDLDEALATWCRAQINAGLPLNGNILKAHAHKVAKEFGYKNFVCSNGWIDRFKNRQNINYAKASKMRPTKASGNLKDSMADWVQRMWNYYKSEHIIDDEYNEMNRELCSEVSDATTEWLETMWLDYRSEYGEDDIYNAEEIGLFYDLTPDEMQKFKEQKCKQGELPQNRLTIFICTNMSGTDKRKLLVIGNKANPSCFKNIQKLPVDYFSNLKAWMTSEIFITYVHKWDSEMRKKERKIILLIDNGIAHFNIPNLTNIKLVFLPPNSNSALLPLHQGIIRSFKTSYRKELLILLNDKMKKNLPLKISIFEAIRMLNDAWYEITVEYIRNCFVKAMLQDALSLDRNACSLTEWMRVHNIEVFKDTENIEDYISVDDGVATSGVPTVKEIVAEMKSMNTTCDDESEEIQEIPTLDEAIEYADRLQLFFQTLSSTDDKLFNVLNFVRHRLKKQRYKNSNDAETRQVFFLKCIFILSFSIIIRT